MNEFKATPDSWLTISQIFRQQKKLILIVIVFYTLLTGLLVMKQKPVYKAQVLIKPAEGLLVNESPIIADNQILFSMIDLQRLYSLGISSILMKDLFYEEKYLPSLSGKKNQLGSFKLYTDFNKLLLVRKDYTTKNKYYELTALADSPDKAINILEQFIVYINSKANVLLELLVAERKMLQLSSPQNNWLSELLWTNEIMNNGINVTNNVNESLIKLYRKDYSLFMMPLTFNPVVNFYSYYSPLQVSNTGIKEPLKATLILGVAGGLLLGFFAASLRVGSTKSSAVSNI